MTLKQREAKNGLLIIVPQLLYFLVFTGVPLVMLFYYATRDYNILKNLNEFNGLDNFIKIFKQPEYVESMQTTLIMSVLITFFTVVISFFLALGLNKVIVGKGFLRTIWYIPVLLPMYVISRLLTTWLAEEGSMNRLFEMIGLQGQDWFRSTFWMYFWIILIVVWKGLGGTTLVFMASLGGVDKGILEAADMDGANGWQKLAKITIPLIRPMMGYILITQFIGAFQILDPVLLISGGGPDQTTKVIMYRIYDEAFTNNNFGFACALSVVVFVFIMILTLVNNKITGGTMFKMSDAD